MLLNTHPKLKRNWSTKHWMLSVMDDLKTMQVIKILLNHLMSIKKTMTASQTQIMFTAGRSEDIGHADLAWALMHADSERAIGRNYRKKYIRVGDLFMNRFSTAESLMNSALSYLPQPLQQARTSKSRSLYFW